MAKLYMVPSVISEGQINSIPEASVQIIHQLKYYVAERARTARRFIKLCQPPFTIQDIEMVEMDKRDLQVGQDQVLQWLKDGHDVGVISESGMPGIADPGKEFASLAHKNNFEVVALPGPSSILLALSASGLNGQHFTFHGYLPIKDNELKNKLNELQKGAQKGQTQIFIETPYRNQRILEQITKFVDPALTLCIAIDISGDQQSIKSKKIKTWAGAKPAFHKIPTVFLIGK